MQNLEFHGCENKHFPVQYMSEDWTDIENAKRDVENIACTAAAPPRVEFFAKCSVLTEILADFKNPDDPDDTSFEPHPENYPVAYLEYPNDDAQDPPRD